MQTTKSRTLIGPVHIIESEFAVFETIDGNVIETGHEPVNFERYDRDGRLLEEISLVRWQIDGVYRDVYLYNVNGVLFEHQEYNEDGTLTGKQQFESGPGGSRISKSYYVNWTNELVLSTRLQFDDQGKLVEVTHYDDTGNILPKQPNSPTTKTIITQIDEFTVEERRFEPDGSPMSSIVTSYDANGNKKEVSCIDPDGTLGIKEVYEYDLDTYGNWTSMKSYRWVIGWGDFHLRPSTITRRKIVYYPAPT